MNETNEGAEREGQTAEVDAEAATERAPAVQSVVIGEPTRRAARDAPGLPEVPEVAPLRAHRFWTFRREWPWPVEDLLLSRVKNGYPMSLFQWHSDLSPAEAAAKILEVDAGAELPLQYGWGELARDGAAMPAESLQPVSGDGVPGEAGGGDELAPLPDLLLGGFEASLEDVISGLADGALGAIERGEPGAFGGRAVAEAFCQGDVSDDRTQILLSLLSQGREVDATLVLAVLRNLGHGEVVDRQQAIREEIARLGDVAVEAVGTPVSFRAGLMGTVVQ